MFFTESGMEITKEYLSLKVEQIRQAQSSSKAYLDKSNKIH